MTDREPYPAVRIDRWLWAARAYKTRSIASQACTGGKVTVNDSSAKPHKLVRAGDEIEFRAGSFDKRLENRGALREARPSTRSASALPRSDPAATAPRERTSARPPLFRPPHPTPQQKGAKADRAHEAQLRSTQDRAQLRGTQDRAQLRVPEMKRCRIAVPFRNQRAHVARPLFSLRGMR